MKPQDFPMKADEFPVDLFLLQLDDYDIFPVQEVEALKLQNTVQDGLSLPPSPEESSLLSSIFLSTTPPATEGAHSSNTGKTSPQGSVTPSSSSSGATPKQKIPRHKRESHINAEHRRRCKIQKGFEEVQALVPSIAEVTSSGSKDSKAAMLNKTIDYCRQLRSESKELGKQGDLLRQEIQALSVEINKYQEELPASGIEFPKPTKPLQLDQMFDSYVRARTFQNWKFWIFGMIMHPLFEAYSRLVDTSNMERFCHTVMSWLGQHCSLVALRPVVLNTLRQLSKGSSIMSNPERLPEEAIKAAMDDSVGIQTPNQQPDLQKNNVVQSGRAIRAK